MSFREGHLRIHFYMLIPVFAFNRLLTGSLKNQQDSIVVDDEGISHLANSLGIGELDKPLQYFGRAGSGRPEILIMRCVG